MTITDGSVLLVALIVSVLVGLTKGSPDSMGPPIPRTLQRGGPRPLKGRAVVHPLKSSQSPDSVPTSGKGEVLVRMELRDRSFGSLDEDPFGGEGLLFNPSGDPSFGPPSPTRGASWSDLSKEAESLRAEAEQLKQAVERSSYAIK